MLASRPARELRYLEVDEDGRLLDSTSSTRSSPTAACGSSTVAHVSNVLGTINPVARDRRPRARRRRRDRHRRLAGRAADAGRRRRDRRRLLRLDRPQGLRADRRRRPARPPRDARGDAAVPRRRRHDQDGRASTTSTWNDLPWKFEAGTPPVAEAVGSARPSTSSSGIGMERVRAHERDAHRLRARAPRRGARPARLRPGRRRRPRRASSRSRSTASHPHDVAEILGRDGVCVRAGHHCAQPLMRASASARPRARRSPCYNTRDDVDRLIDGAASGPRGLPARLRTRWTTPSTARRSSSTTSAPTTGASCPTPTSSFEDTNPLCGDELKVMLKVADDGTVEDVRFAGHGCAISQASASMISDEIKGMKVDDVARLDRERDPRPARHPDLRDAHEVRAAVAEGAQERRDRRQRRLGARDARGVESRPPRRCRRRRDAAPRLRVDLPSNRISARS